MDLALTVDPVIAATDPRATGVIDHGALASVGDRLGASWRSQQVGCIVSWHGGPFWTASYDCGFLAHGFDFFKGETARTRVAIPGLCASGSAVTRDIFKSPLFGTVQTERVSVLVGF